MSSKRFRGSETVLSPEEQQIKINEVRKLIGPIADKLPVICSETSISRYLRARNWHTNKAGKMLKESIKWRLQFKPESIRWDDVANEAGTGKIYKANYFDKEGRTVLIMRPGMQNTKDAAGQIKHVVYCMENAIMTLNPDQEQMVWLIDFQGWSMSCTTLKSATETAKILQNQYPERLALAILYNPPKVFESFWMMVKPFVEPKTCKKVKFVYSSDPQSQKLMEELFDLGKLESAFGGRNSSYFDFELYGQRMRDDEKKVSNMTGQKSFSRVPSFALEFLESGTSTPTTETASEVGDYLSDSEIPRAETANETASSFDDIMNNKMGDSTQTEQPKQLDHV